MRETLDTWALRLQEFVPWIVSLSFAFVCIIRHIFNPSLLLDLYVDLFPVFCSFPPPSFYNKQLFGEHRRRKILALDLTDEMAVSSDCSPDTRNLLSSQFWPFAGQQFVWQVLVSGPRADVIYVSAWTQHVLHELLSPPAHLACCTRPPAAPVPEWLRSSARPSHRSVLNLELEQQAKNIFILSLSYSF